MTVRYLVVTLFLLELYSFGEARQAQRLLNGTEVTSITEFPFVALVKAYFKGEEHVFGKCTASIINEDTILTATHCICKQEFNQTRVYVLVGISNFRERTNAYKAKTPIVADSTDCEGTKYDVAVLKLEKSLTFSDKVQPIKIDYKKPDLGTRVVMLGSGKKSITGDSDGKLRFARNKLKGCHGPDPNEPDVIYENYKGMLCVDASEEANAMIYHGDSGGPLVHYKNGEYYQIGVNSGGISEVDKEGNRRCTSNGKCYAMFVSTEFNKDFLKKNI